MPQFSPGARPPGPTCSSNAAAPGTVPAPSTRTRSSTSTASSGTGRGAGGTAPHPRLGDTDGLSLTVCYLDQNPLDVAARMGPLLAERWSDPGVSPQLAAPFHAVRAGEWDRSLP